MSPPPPPSPASPPSAEVLLHRRQVLQLLGISVVATGCGTLRVRPTPVLAPAPAAPASAPAPVARAQTVLHLVSPDVTGSPPLEVMEALLDTGRLLSRHLGFDGRVNDALLESYLRLKCEERPSYLTTYTRFASEVKRPGELSVAWLSEMQELYRVKVVGELAIMLLIGGGFQAFGFANFNGYMGGFWHHPQSSGSFRASDEL